MKVLFFICLYLSLHSYFIYPLMMLLLPERKKKTNPEATPLPDVSIIITAYNEEQRITKKIENTLALDYPQDKLQIIIASDCSSDRTDMIVKDFAVQGIELVRAEQRHGKEYTQSLAIKQARGEIIVFSDVATEITADGIHRIVQHYQDASVGAVSSTDRFVSEQGKVVGEGVYVKYEMWLRDLESAKNSLVGLSGSFFSARRQVCTDWDNTVPSDFNTAMNCVKMGYVAISAADVIGVYQDIKDPDKEYQRKLRTVIRGFAALHKNLQVLNPFKYGLFAFQMLSHKVLRWLEPWFLLALLCISYITITINIYYEIFFYLQVVFYVLYLMAIVSNRCRQNILCKIPYYFVQANVAIAHASILYVSGKRITKWEPSKR